MIPTTMVRGRRMAKITGFIDCSWRRDGGEEVFETC